MSGKLKNKLKSKKGETITETLVSVLIAAAAMILFASMITSSQRILKKSESIMNDYYAGEAEMEAAMAADTEGAGKAKSGSTAEAGDAKSGGTTGEVKNGTVIIKQANDTLPRYGINNNHKSGKISVRYATNQPGGTGTSTSGIERFAIAEYKAKD